MSDLPVELNKRQNIMNSLAHKYKEEDLLVEPNLNDIYNEIDLAMDKISIRFSADRLNSSSK